MNEIEAGRLLAIVATLDPRAPQGDPDGFIRRMWARVLHDVPADAAQQAVVDYYRSDRYAQHRDSLAPADIVQWWNARRRPTERERTGESPATRRAEPRPAADPEQIRSGVDRVMAMLAARRALPAGATTAEVERVALGDEHQGDAGARRLARSVRCPWPPCGAQPGQPCVGTGGRPLQHRVAHDARLDAAYGQKSS